MRTIPLMILVLILSGSSGALVASEYADKAIEIRIVAPGQLPAVDGRLDDAIWREATVVRDFHQVKPAEYQAPGQQTEVWLLRDAHTLYIAARLDDDHPDGIRASEFIQGKQTDADDQFHVTLDTFSNGRNGYFFQLNPNGIRTEALITNDSFDGDWTAIWQGQARRTEQGWQLEMAIPFKSLSFSPDQEDWGINFGRVIERNQETIAWSSAGADSWEMAPIVASRMRSMSGLEQGRGLDLVGGLVSRQRNDESAELVPSLDLFYRPTSGLTLATTINTDFSATEVDDRVVNLSRFSVFLPEKRDFFLQDAHLFRFGGIRGNGMPFFSRRIGLADNGQVLDIDVGSKLSGRAGQWEFGTLAVRQDTLDDAETVFVGRASRLIGDHWQVGALLTDGDPIDQAGNRVLGVDYSMQRNDFLGDRTLRSTGWLMQSEDGLDGRGQSFGVTLDYPNDALSIRSSYRQIDDQFSPALGFVNRTGIREARLNVGRRFRFEDQWLSLANLWSDARVITDLDGQLQTRDLRVWPVNIGNRAGDFLSIGLFDQYERLDEGFSILPDVAIESGTYRMRRHRLFFETAESRPFSLRAVLTRGDFFGGSREDQELALRWRPFEKLMLAASTSRSALELPGGNGITRLHSLRTELAINTRWAWLSTLQYDNLSRELGVNSRLRWLPRAGQSMNLVLNQTHLNLDDWRKQDQELSVKVAYTWRF